MQLRQKKPRRPLRERFMSKVSIGHAAGCWEWTAHRGKHGYGVIGLGSRADGVETAHRVSWMLFRGDPAGLDVCHHCDNRGCVNPEHLFVGDAAANIADARRKGRTKRKLSDDAIREILSSSETSTVLAARFGITPSGVRKVWAGEIKGGVL